MNSRMLTLFGEELVPEQLKAAPKASLYNNAAEENDEETQGIPDDWQPEKQYYTIGEVAALFHVRTSHIRFWTKEFELNVRTTVKGDRLFTATNIMELKAIYHLIRERGFTIPGAKARMKDKQRITPETTNLRQTLLKLRNRLLLIRNQLV